MTPISWYDEAMGKKYYKHKLENLLLINKIAIIHYLEFDHDFRSEREAHDFWELVYADRGDIVCEIDDGEIVLHEGEVRFHKPGEIHALRAEGEKHPCVFIVCFECKSEAIRFFEDKSMPMGKNLLRFVFGIIAESQKTFDLPEADPTLKKMKLLSAPALGGQQLIKNYLELLLINLMRDETEKEYSEDVFLPPEQYEERVASLVIEYLKEHITQKVSIVDICETLHYNKSYLFKQFKKATGQGVMTYFTGLKISEAKKMLRTSTRSINQIADTFAFDTPNYFSKCFKRLTGSTPSAYRKKHKKKKEKT